MLSPAVLWQGLYYARFIWYVQIDAKILPSLWLFWWNRQEEYIEGNWGILPTFFKFPPFAANHPVLQYQSILKSMVEYIQYIEDQASQDLALAVHKVVSTHLHADCYAIVARHLRASLPAGENAFDVLFQPQQKKCNKFRCGYNWYDPNDKKKTPAYRCIVCEESAKPVMLRSVNENRFEDLLDRRSRLRLPFDMLKCHAVEKTDH